jgi:hypothetical protein
MAMVIIPEGQTITMTLNDNVSLRLPKNKKVQVDRIKIAKNSASGYSARIVGVYKNPLYIDMGWFRELNRSVKIFKG